jgi:tetratricopeptide (TPR) repeat protein
MAKRSRRSRSTPRSSGARKASKTSGGPRSGASSGSSKRGTASGAVGEASGRFSRLAERPWFWPTLIFASALALRIIYIIQIRDTPFFQTLGLDAKFYDRWARELMRGEGSSGAFFMSPLYPYFLALIYRLFGRDLALVRLIQAGIGSLSAVLLYLLARDVFDRRVGIIAGFLAATYGALIFYDGSVLMTPLLVILHLTALLLLVRGDATRVPLLFVLSGVAIGVSAVGRAAALLFVPVALAWIWGGKGVAWRPAGGRGESPEGAGGERGGAVGSTRRRLRNARLAGAGFLLLGIALVVVPITVRNYVASRDLVLITSNGGLNFYIGNSEISTGGYVKPEELDIATDPDGAAIAERDLGRDLKPSEVSNYWYARAGGFIRSNPGAWLKLLVRKVSFAMSSYELPQLENYYFQKRYSALLSLPLPGFAVIAPLGLVGLAISLKKRRAQLLGLFFATYVVSIALFFVVARYRLPAVPALLAGAGYLLLEAWRWVRERRWRAVAGASIALAFLLFIVNANIYRIDTAKAFAQPHFRLGIVYGDRGLRDQAIAEYRTAIAIDPGYPKSYLNLGALLAEAGRDDEAVEAFRQAVALDPRYAAARVNMAMAYEGRGDYDAALAQTDTVLAFEPENAMAAKERGIILYRMGRADEAAQALRAAHEWDREGSQVAEIEFYLGLIEGRGRAQLPAEAVLEMSRADTLLRGARPVEALQALEAAARLAPDSGEPLRRMALVKRDMGLLEEAVELMRAALRVDPWLEHGHFAMGVLLNEVGRHDEAINEYDAELRIDRDYRPAHLNLALIFQFHRANPNRAAFHYGRYLELGGERVEMLDRALEAGDAQG